MILFLDKVIRKIALEYRKCVFRKSVKSCGSNLKIFGQIHLINRNLVCGNNVAIYPGVQFFGDGPIVIGNHVHIGNNTLIYASKNAGIVIGNDTLIAGQCYIIDTDHGTEMGKLICEQPNKSTPIHIGDDVWIAAGSKVLRSSNIGNGAVIGAMGLVKGEVAPYTINVGIPVRTIGHRGEQ